MMYRTIVLAAGVLWSTHVSAGDLAPPVYVAPGGIYIGSAKVYVAPGLDNGERPYAAPTYAPGYGPHPIHPAPAYYGVNGPAYYGANGAAYIAPPAYAVRGPAYGHPHAVEFSPRPPAAVPNNGRCYVDLNYGRVMFCD